MQVQVDRHACTGCGICLDICGAVFELNRSGLAEVIANPVPPEQEQACREAASSCPARAITLQQ